MGERALVPPAHPSSAAPVEPHVYPSPCRAVGLGGQINSYRTWVFYLASRPHTSFQQCSIHHALFLPTSQKDQTLPGPACMGWPLLCHGPAPAGQMLLPPPKPDAGRSGKDPRFPQLDTNALHISLRASCPPASPPQLSHAASAVPRGPCPCSPASPSLVCGHGGGGSLAAAMLMVSKCHPTNTCKHPLASLTCF